MYPFIIYGTTCEGAATPSLRRLLANLSDLGTIVHEYIQAFPHASHVRMDVGCSEPSHEECPHVA
jgi:hypothetical protein